MHSANIAFIILNKLKDCNSIISSILKHLKGSGGFFYLLMLSGLKYSETGGIYRPMLKKHE